MAFANPGIAYIYITQDGWVAIQPGIAAARQHGTPLEVLDRPRAERVLLQLCFNSVVDIIFDSRSVRLRAADAIAALAEHRTSGRQVRCEVRVESIAVEGGQVAGVVTTEGFVSCSRVIVAAGVWSRPLLATVGANLSGEPVIVARYMTHQLTGIDISLPMLMFSDSGHRFYIREKRGGLLIGGADSLPLPTDRFVEADAPPADLDDLPHAHAHRMRDYLRKVEQVMPVLAEAEIERTTRACRFIRPTGASSPMPCRVSPDCTRWPPATRPVFRTCPPPGGTRRRRQYPTAPIALRHRPF